MPDTAQVDTSLPCDSHAERALISFGLLYPERTLDLGVLPTDFYDLRRRRVWMAMVTVRLLRASESPAEYLLRVCAVVLRNEPHAAKVLSKIDLSVDWVSDRSTDCAQTRDIFYWVDRLKRCVVARKLIDAAQQIAERAYRVPHESFDVADASVVLSRVAGVPIREELGMELPV
jgi:hypothetical protein